MPKFRQPFVDGKRVGLDSEVDDQGSLSRTTASGIGWSWIALVVTSLLQIVYTASMSRLVDPASFGLVAAALVGMRFISFFSNLGLGNAVIQRSSLDDDTTRTAAGLAIALGVVAFVVAISLSPVLAKLVNQPDTATAMRWLALGFIASGFNVVPDAILKRRMKFRTLAMIQVISFAVGYLMVGIPMAAAGSGVGSLIAANLSQSYSMLALLWLVGRPFVRPRIHVSSVRSLVAFGSRVSLTGFFEFLGSSLDTLAVSRWLGAAGLGQYSRASYLVGLPVDQATAAASRVLLPSFAAVQEEPDRFSRGYSRSSGVFACIVIIPTTFAAAGAGPLVELVLGPDWAAAASVLPLVAAAYGFNLLSHLPAVAAEAKGEVAVKLVIQVIALLAIAALIGATILSGPTLKLFALAWLGSEALRHFLYVVWVFPRLGLLRRPLAGDYAAASVVALATGAPIWILSHRMGWTGTNAVVVGGLAGLVTGGLSMALPIARTLRSDIRWFTKALRGA